MEDLFEFMDGPVLPAVQVSPYDLMPVKALLENFKAIIDDLHQQADALTVNSSETCKQAVHLAGTAKKKNAEIEKNRKELVGPPNDYVKSVNNLAKGLQTPLANIEMLLKRKISQYETRLRLEQEKAQKEAEIQAKALQEKINQEAEAAGVEPPVVVTPVLPITPAPVRTEAGTASQRKDWTFSIEDPSKIPNEYLMIDMQKIRRAVRDGIREIPGVRIFEDYTTTIRR